MRRSALSASLISAIGILATAGAIACGGSSQSATAPTPTPTPTPTPAPPPTPPSNGASGATVNATPALAFNPDTVTVQSGATVTYAFGSVAHNIFFDAQNGAPADITGANANVNIGRTFSTAGTYHYTCHIHPFMHGTIIVR